MDCDPSTLAIVEAIGADAISVKAPPAAQVNSAETKAAIKKKTTKAKK